MEMESLQMDPFLYDTLRRVGQRGKMMQSYDAGEPQQCADRPRLNCSLTTVIHLASDIMHGFK
jgi:hypothetical protein